MQHSVDPGSKRIETITTEFRFEALQLCQKSQNAVSWHLTQHLLDELWSLETPVAKDRGILYLCPQCGATLHPGWMGSCLRVSRLRTPAASRTRRRRLQRQQRRALLAQAKRSKITNKANHPKKNIGNASTSDAARALLVPDSDILLDRHHLEIGCGKCQARTRIKGLKREAPLTKTEIQRQQMAQSVAPGKNITKSEKKTGLSDNFLELPPVSAITATRGWTESKPLSLGRPSKGGKNNNKLRETNKKSKLMSFLSSLND